MSTELQNQLQATLGSAYTLERELGGGGMSRVFVADETALGRKVVVKVLPPELAAGVSVDRFKREIQVAARLQHPHIVPVLSAGETKGLPYYTMPFVEGSNLRARLSRGPLSITEGVGVLREVARALAYAHEHGVVHRDIKPDNVLLTGGSAVVTDFGIAKALSASRLETPESPTLTALGTSLGTPTYMAPEQAAGDPATNSRADIYAFGCMAYEVLTGRPPFHGLTPHRLMAAHMGEKPQPVIELRPDTPAALGELVMRCLEKEPDNRPQQAADLARVLETVTSGGNTQQAMPAALLGGRGMLKRALAIYAAGFVVVAVVAKAAIVGIGLPDWVFPGALVVMALGLPVILFTAYVHRATRRAFTTTPALTPGGTPSPQGTLATIALKASPHVSWRRTALGGAYALGAFVLLIASWMIMRALGIGPAASLMAAGKLGEREKVILAEFKGPLTDSLLAPTVTEAFRTDLAQSANLNVIPANAVREVLRLMQRPTNTRVDFTIAREIATREGIKAVVDGEVVSLGGSYVLSARLVSAQTGEELGSFRETAREAKEIIPAISRLSKQLRSKVGESLRSIQNARTLDKVTTPSLPALQKYVMAVRVIEQEGDWDKGRRLLDEAIALDTGFAMAYRKLAVEMNNRFLSRASIVAAIQKAYDHRDRLSDAERYLTLAGYYQWGPKPDRAKIISSYESILDLQPDNVTALNNLAVQYRYRREYAKAEELTTRAIAIQPATSVYYNNQYWSQVAQGKASAANATVQLAARNIPRNSSVVMLRSYQYFGRGEFDSVAAVNDSARRSRPNDFDLQSRTTFWLGASDITRGRLRSALQWWRASNEANAALSSRDAPLQTVLDSAQIQAWFLGDKERALRTLERGLAVHPLDSLPAVDRPYDRLAFVYSLVGQPDRAKATVSAFDRRRAEAAALDDEPVRHQMQGHIAIAERRYDDAVREYRLADEGSCTVCALPNVARAYDLAGNLDSALAVFARYTDGVSDPQARPFADMNNLAGAHKRLGELYEAKGQREKARTHYSAFIELWKNADPELQPLVKQARDRLAALQRAERK